MAQTLTEDCSYSLRTEEDERKLVYFVKLTDSCLRSIEEHVTSKDAIKGRAFIKFSGDNGTFSIPRKLGGHDNKTKKFSFTCSKLQAVESNPLQGILECIHHTRDRLVSYGPLEKKVSVAASDDSYEQTRNRMAQADQERKDVSTKEIKFDTKVKKGKKTKTNLVTPDMRQKMAQKKPTPSQRISSPLTTGAHNSPMSQKKPAVPSKNSPSLNGKGFVPVVPKTHIVTNNGKTFSCRERVMHVLALRSHKKPELITRLQKEGMSQKDRNNLAMVLKQVSIMADNSFKLLPNLYQELKVDTWPFYSESEKLVVKRNIAVQKQKSTPSPQIVSSTSKSPETKPQKATKRPYQADSSNNGVEEPSSTSSTSPTESKLRKAPNKPSLEEESPPTVASTSDTPEHLITYKPIISYQQRCEYKRDFEADYPEYIKLKKHLDAIRTKFIELDRSWRRQELGSSEYQRLHDDIIKAYNETQDDKYKEMRARCEELHQKLDHIKKLVLDYDNNCRT